MRVVLQRSKEASVTVDGEIGGQNPFGLKVLGGSTHEDTDKDATHIAEKIANIRMFEDETGKMHHAVLAVEGHVLSIWKFTL
ncbi:D-aminoacyl-tRNA deacylase, partial [Bacillus paranthracis]|uniref:D-aminoacyl-tRNA deacylase n=1 Tax=Bacillus paranthracis TaxID=2026186 RepID=UPI00284C5B62